MSSGSKESTPQNRVFLSCKKQIESADAEKPASLRAFLFLFLFSSFPVMYSKLISLLASEMFWFKS